MNDYRSCTDQAKLIHEKFHELVGGNKYEFFIEYPDVAKLGIKNPILVLGLNPSGGDDDRKKRKYPALFSYIPQIHETLSGFTNGENEQAEKLAYKPYFKPYVESFQQLDPPFNPVWYNKEILQDILTENSHIEVLNGSLSAYLEHFCQYDNGNYILFADLIQYQRTNAKDITSHLHNEDVKKMVSCYIELMLNFIKPKLVLSANAFVSHYLVENISNKADAPCTYIDQYGTRIFLSSMLTGQRAMDVFSRLRLFNEINDYIKRN